MSYIDLSQPIYAGMPVYPGDIPVLLEHSQIYSRDHYNNHRLETGMHIGTHIDGRMHMLDVNESIGNVPLDTFCGKGGIIRSENESIIRMKACYSEIIKGKSIILFHTGMDKYYGEERYYMEHPVLDLSLCQYLAENKIRMIGVDMPSPDRIPFEVHKYLLHKNIYIIENLTNLDQIADSDQFEVFAFPLKIHADSSMARVAARIIRS